MKNNNFYKSMLMACGLAITSTQIHAGGYQISEASVAGLGRAFAGAGVVGDDASDIFYNPAGMFLAEGRQFQAGLSVLDISSDFTTTSSTFGGKNDDGGEVGAVPNLYYIFPGSNNLKYGISITAPFGLVTEYDNNWSGRYHALRSELLTLDINPSVAYKINDQLSIGGGISFQYADVELTSARFLGLNVPDGKTKVAGDDWGYGFNLGLMFTPSESTRFGIGFRSKVTQKVEGDLDVTTADGRSLISAGADAEVDLPETVYLSAFHSLNDKVDLMFSGRWTNWSRFDELRISFDNGLPDDVTEENWDDSWTLAIGANYHVNDQWTLRAGYAYDETPVVDEFRTARIPDSDRDWLTLGVNYKPSDTLSIDFGYAHLFGEDVPLDETRVVAGPPSSPVVVNSRINGSFDGDTDIFGIQARWKF